MIRRGTSVGSICLRCRLRLLGRLAPARPYTNDSPYSGDDPRSNHDPAMEPQEELRRGQFFGLRDWDFEENQSSKATIKPPQDFNFRRKATRLYARKRHVSGNRILDETSKSLGINMLGKPAHAIVMRDGGNKWEKKQNKFGPKKFGPFNAAVKVEPDTNVAASIQALLNSRHDDPDHDDVRSNIAQLEPTIDKVLTEKDFRKVQRLLADGFLNSQLLDYISWFKSQKTSSEYEWITGRSSWSPLKVEPGASEGTVPSLRGYIQEDTPARERLVIRLMRDCWGLSIAELQNQMGEIEIKVRNHEFVLLLRGQQRFLNALGNIFLEPGETIEAFRDQSAILLVTKQPKVESILKELDETLRSVSQKTFPLTLVESEHIDDAVLEEVGRITNTHIRKSRTGRRLHVTWIEVASRAEQGFDVLEDMAHIVLRLLLTGSGSKQATSTLLSPTDTHLQSRPGRLVVDVTSKDKLTWRDRLSQWARFMYPRTPVQVERDPNSQVPVQFQLPFKPVTRTKLVNENTEFFPVTRFPSHPVRWSNELQTRTIACFGNILHQHQPGNPTPPLADLLASTERRAFAPSMPHPLRLAKFESSDPENSTNRPLVNTTQTLLLRFWPSPSWNPATRANNKSASAGNPGDTPPAPVLELRLAASDTEVLGIDSLRAISKTHHTDVMFPSSLVDVRFTQTQYEEVRCAYREDLAEWFPLRDFLANARLDLASGKVELPPRQRFPVPRRLFAFDPSDPQAKPPTPKKYKAMAEAKAKKKTELERKKLAPHMYFADEDEAEGTKVEPRIHLQEVEDPHDLDDLISISYEFVGLEYHRSASMPYDGHLLTYTSIEAGQGGGRRAEVTLEAMEPLPSSKPAAEAADEQTPLVKFLKSCSTMIADRSLWSGIGDIRR
ncbi:hypothetical protein F4808DRAFT_415081 [Astrocystis sublimbata]|nr:hypothetical protein F4808DRAFT_415081 [Astrocystis sublimbata]